MKYGKKLYVYLATMCIAAGLSLFMPIGLILLIPMVDSGVVSFTITVIFIVCYLFTIGFVYKDLKLVVYTVIITVITLGFMLCVISIDIPDPFGYGFIVVLSALGFGLLVTGIVFLIFNLYYNNKYKNLIPLNGNYPLSPKSINKTHISNFGTTYQLELKASEKNYYIAAVVSFVICLVIGTVANFEEGFPNYYFYKFFSRGFFLYVLGIILIAIFIYIGIRHRNLYIKNTIEQLGQERLNRYFKQQKTSFNRAVDIPYYSECDELKSINFAPSVYARGGTFATIEATDVLIDEVNGKFAVCTTYGDTTLYPANVFEMSKVLVVSLENKGETIYVTQNQDGAARAMLGYMVAGGLGAMVGASTATTKTVAKKLDDLSVVITYNDLGRAYLTFKFGKDKVGAENLYQIFTVVSMRNENNK